MPEPKPRTAADVAYELTVECALPYRTQVNLEAAIQNAVCDGLSLANAEKFARDVVENLLDGLFDGSSAP